ncbi:hypothetical protein SAMN05216571_1275 [Onishia taeanensis]|uniref:Tetratricopeptide repeat protein n=1 Tax=Onishia taeanensis TaxID=284577 RepID=A0A1G7VN78_9GAMM|nr:hypothetical protein [Halomonas taeanensis]SDG61266.1 hypothetical protein SAMN05216571_1275 [Halomonas taeanensis]
MKKITKWSMRLTIISLCSLGILVGIHAAASAAVPALTEEIADTAIELLDSGDIEPSEAIAKLEHVEAITREHDVSTQVRAKLHHALGYAYMSQGGNDPQALHHLSRALQLHDSGGNTDEIQRLQRELKNAGQGATEKDTPA